MLGADYIRVLYVDLTKEKVSVEERKDLFHLLGGTGVAAKLLEENMHPELPALHEDQPIVFAIGPLSTIFPVATKTVATFISPLTGEYGESHAGGRSAMAIRNAGYDAIVITGKARRPTFLNCVFLIFVKFISQNRQNTKNRPIFQNVGQDLCGFVGSGLVV